MSSFSISPLLVVMLIFVGCGCLSCYGQGQRRNEFQNVEMVGIQFQSVLYHSIEFANLSGSIHADAATETPTRVVVLGGVDYENSFENLTFMGIQVYSLALWRDCKPPGGGKERKFAYHTSILTNNQDIFVHGGIEYNDNGELSIIPDMFQLFIKPSLTDRSFFCTYNKIEGTGDVPGPRFGHALVKYDEETFFILNGCNTLEPGTQRGLFHSYIECSSQYSDLHMFNLSSNSWTRFEVQQLPTLSFHHFGLYNLGQNTFFYAFGGYSDNSLSSDRNEDMFVFPIPDVGNDIPLIARKINGYEAIITRNRGAIDNLAHDVIQYFCTPVINSTFSNSLKVVPIRGEFQGTELDALTFTWRKYDFISAIHVPGSAVESLNSFALGGGLAYRRFEEGNEGVLIGVLINVAFGAISPVWHTNIVSPTTIATNTITPNAHIAVRTFGTVTQLDNHTFFLMGGIASAPRTTSFLLQIEEDDVIAEEEDLDGSGGSLSINVPSLKVLPNLPSSHLARAGHCVVPLEDGRLLIAGGTFDFLSLGKKRDVFYTRERSDIFVAGEGLKNYTDLLVNGHVCFRRGSFVFSVGGQKSFNVSANSVVTELYDDSDADFGSSTATKAPVHIWNEVTGWSPCQVDGFDYSLSYGIAEMLESSPIHSFETKEEVIWFGGWDSNLARGTDFMYRLSCHKKQWEDCTCSDLRFGRIYRPTNSPGPENEEGEFWPAERLSMCSATLGSRRLVMNGGHFNGKPRVQTFTFHFNADGNPEWSTLHQTNNDLVSHPDTALGPQCFSWKRIFYTIGGAANGALVNSLHGFYPTCNLGFGIPDGKSYLESTCEPCELSEYRDSFHSDQCLTCNDGIERMPSTVGDSPRKCSVCDDAYCLHGGRCLVSASVEAVCECPFWYGNDRCAMFLEDKLLQSIFIPLALIGVGILLVFGRKYLKKVKVSTDINKRLLSDTAAELYELHSTWEIRPSDLEFVKSIGRGGFGDVWLAKWLVRDEIVAVKKLLLPRSVGEEGLESIFATQRNETISSSKTDSTSNDLDSWEDWGEADSLFTSFASEIKFMKSIKHRNIVYFYGACLDFSNSFIVMEYIKRGSLADVIADKAIAIDRKRRLNFMRDAAAGMNYLHNLSPPRIHRDLKSFNLLVTENWIVKVADFTTAKKLLLESHGSSSTQSKKQKRRKRGASSGDNEKDGDGDGDDDDAEKQEEKAMIVNSSTLGTIPWTAPEILEHQPYSLPVDVYSFGIVMWEVLSRELPYDDLRFVHQIRDHVLRGGRPDISEEMWEDEEEYLNLACACWDRSPNARPTFSKVEKDLAQLYFKKSSR
eukprot:m.72777 g.72777  ORF g.72777 m.72777 type:complete len:1317 (+) comp11755_c0_seq2:109-4059(+)